MHGHAPITITRAGKPVASLRPLGPPALSADVLLARWRRLPAVDAASLRRDIDRIVDADLRARGTPAASSTRRP